MDIIANIAIIFRVKIIIIIYNIIVLDVQVDDFCLIFSLIIRFIWIILLCMEDRRLVGDRMFRVAFVCLLDFLPVQLFLVLGSDELVVNLWEEIDKLILIYICIWNFAEVFVILSVFVLSLLHHVLFLFPSYYIQLFFA